MGSRDRGCASILDLDGVAGSRRRLDRVPRWGGRIDVTPRSFDPDGVVARAGTLFRGGGASPRPGAAPSGLGWARELGFSRWRGMGRALRALGSRRRAG